MTKQIADLEFEILLTADKIEERVKAIGIQLNEY